MDDDAHAPSTLDAGKGALVVLFLVTMIDMIKLISGVAYLL